MTIHFGDGTSVTTAPTGGTFAAHAIVADRGSGGNGTFSSG